MNNYHELLKHPKWQKKRLEILERDDYACQNCFDTDSMLIVHHLIYYKDRKPWEYDNSELITLCERCNAIEHNQNYNLEHAENRCSREEEERNLLKILKLNQWFAEDLNALACELHSTSIRKEDIIMWIHKESICRNKKLTK